MKKQKRIVSLLLALMLVLTMTIGCGQTALATAPATEKPESEMTEAEKKAKEEKEKREKEIQAAFELPIQSNALPGWPQGPGTYDEAAILMDGDTGAILYAKNIDKTEYPASITKMLTALLAFEYDISPEKGVLITPEALACLGSGYASIGLKEGNIITFDQAMYAMLLASANEAAYAVGATVAEVEGQDYNWFIQRMNERTRELGGVNSNFVNTNGVFDPNHFTCARDMALITKELFKYPHLFEIAQTQQYTIEKTDAVEEHIFQQKHHMLIQGNTDYYEYAVAGKTGFTTEAENTLITMADNGERKLITVVLKSYSGHPYPDTRALMDYGFANFSNHPIREELTDELQNGKFRLVDENACVTLPSGVDFDDLRAEVKEPETEESVGTLTYYYEDNPVGVTHICYQDVEPEIVEPEPVQKPVEEEPKEPDYTEQYAAMIAILVVIMLIFCMILAWIVTKITRKLRK